MGQRKQKNVVVDDNASRNIVVGTDSGECCYWWLLHKGIATTFLCIAVFALLVRICVSLHPYSGAASPPKFGDFEAQRHWMEVTLNLPIEEWYTNTTQNDLSYWGLDYPPLTAYQSYIHGLFVRFFHPDSISLFTSRGHESYVGKLLMRLTVLSSDVVIFFPAVFYFVIVYHARNTSNKESNIAWHIAMLLLNPCLILIDHGHFQYNGISLGLTVGAVAAIIAGRDLVGSFLFSLALNHKQMSAYFAPAFFSHLLGKCLRRRSPLLEVSKLGFVVIGTFAAVWWPYLQSTNSFLQVISRLTPFERGIYEDYVANFWCTSSVLIKWKRLFSTESLKFLSFIATIGTCLPSMVQQIKSPSKQGFIYGMLNSSMSFYLFSFQVHEKSILLPLLPVTLLALEEPFLLGLLTHLAMLSMFPLLCRDNLVAAYIALFALFILIFNLPGRNRNNGKGHATAAVFVFVSTSLCSLVLHIVYLTKRPPDKYPFLFEAMIMLFCFIQFILLALSSNIKQWALTSPLKLKEL